MEQMTLRISDNLMAWLRGDAKAQNRNMNNHIETILMFYRARVLAEADENFPKQRIEFFNTEV